MLVGLLIVVVAVWGLGEAKTKQVCFQNLGCFTNEKPFAHFVGLPESPEHIHLRCLLYTRKNTKSSESVGYDSSRTLANSHFDAKKPVKIVIHGYLSSGTDGWMVRMKDALLTRGDFNVFLIDWKKGAGINYLQSTANTRTVAAVVKRLLDIMVVKGVNWDDVHIIGHSLGAQVAGMVGHLSKSKIGRISGLDPAKPSFENMGLAIRLDKTDAKFVDAIHTNMDKFTVLSGFGTTNPSGHVDFYPNGGKNQPGCKKLKVACSHKRAHDYYEESIYATCNFVGYPCKSYDDYNIGKCMQCGKSGCGFMGYFANTSKGRGNLYLSTKGSSPYCGYPYLVSVVPDKSTKSIEGKLILTLKGSSRSSVVSITDSDVDLPSSTQALTRMVTFDAGIGRISGLSVKFDNEGIFPLFAHYLLGKIIITDPKTTKSIITCGKKHDLKDGQTHTLRIGTGRC